MGSAAEERQGPQVARLGDGLNKLSVCGVGVVDGDLSSLQVLRLKRRGAGRRGRRLGECLRAKEVKAD